MNRNDSGNRGSITGSHATTFNKRKFKEDFKKPKRRNHPGNCTKRDGPHSSKAAAQLWNRVETWKKFLKTPTSI